METNLRGRQILIVDDEKAYCRVVGELLAEYGYDVSVAYDAGDALFRLKNTHPDLILMDVMMPQIDGLSLIGRLRLSEPWGKIPIIVVSAKAQPADRIAAIGAGANGFLPKPFTANMLRTTIEQHLPDLTASIE